MESRSLILVADVPEGAEHIKRLLSTTHDLVMVHNLTAASRLVENVDFDGVIAGIHFDDCRMMELLKVVRKEPRYARRPFVVVRILPTELHPDMETNAKTMASVLGASGYVTIEDADGEPDADVGLRSLIVSLLKVSQPAEHR